MLKPPDMQNLDRRVKFFIQHPEYPGAAKKLQQCRRFIAARNKGSVTTKKIEAKVPVFVAPEKKAPVMGFIAKLFGQRKTMAGQKQG